MADDRAAAEEATEGQNERSGVGSKMGGVKEQGPSQLTWNSLNSKTDQKQEGIKKLKSDKVLSQGVEGGEAGVQKNQS